MEDRTISVGIKKKKQLRKYESIETNIEVSNVTAEDKDIDSEIEKLRDTVRKHVNHEIAVHRKEAHDEHK